MAKKKRNRTRCTKWGTTELEERFCHEFIRDYNATQAMLRSVSKGTMNAARVAGCMALRKKVVRDRIDALQKEVFERCKCSMALVVKELMDIVFFDPRRVASWNAHGMTLVDSKKLTLEDARMVESVESRVDSQGNTIMKFKRASRMDALKVLAMLQKEELNGEDIRERARSLRFAFEAMGLEQVPEKEVRE